MDPVSVLYVTKLSTNTGEPQGGGSNKDGGPELGYHNKLSQLSLFASSAKKGSLKN